MLTGCAVSQADYDHAVETFTNLVNKFPDTSFGPAGHHQAAAALARNRRLAANHSCRGRPVEFLPGQQKQMARMNWFRAGSCLSIAHATGPGKFRGAVATLKLLNAAALSLDLNYQRASLLCQAELAAGDLDKALVASTNLLQIARSAKGRRPAEQERHGAGADGPLGGGGDGMVGKCHQHRAVDAAKPLKWPLLRWHRRISRMRRRRWQISGASIQFVGGGLAALALRETAIKRIVTIPQAEPSPLALRAGEF